MIQKRVFAYIFVYKINVYTGPCYNMIKYNQEENKNVTKYILVECIKKYVLVLSLL